MYIKVSKLSKDFKLDICYVPVDIYNSLELESDVKYTLNLGGVNKKVFLHPGEEDSKVMAFPRHIFNKLMLFSDVELNIWKVDKDIYLGPVVGVFVNNRYIASIEKRDIPESCARHIEANKEAKCLVYYFSIERINWVKNKIKGFVFAPRQKDFRYYWLPLPDVIYDRGVNFKREEKMLVKHIRKQFKYNPNVNYINNKDYLSKWHLYKRLAKHEKAKKYLPETIKYKDFEDVKDMLMKHDFIFMKSYYGSRGREVMSIKKYQEYYEVNFYNKGLVKKKFTNLEDLRSHVEEFIEDKKYVVQQGINLAKYEGKKFDLRVLLEKDINGKWVAIYNQARVAKEKVNITNCSAGGDVMNYSDIVFRQEKSTLPKDDILREKTIDVAKFIELEYGKFGELGMDMAIDIDGNIWFLEANTKPDKNPEPGLEKMEGISPQFISILEYSRFLSNKGEMK